MNLKQCVSTPKRRPSSEANHWREDPFANRKNFPVFDDAIRTETTIDENTLDENDAEDVDNSVCSYASTDMLNLSIGARAALDEHLRHVAKFGIDNSHYLEEKDREQDCSFESHQKDPRDVLWQKLVDPNVSHNAANNSSDLLSRDMLRLINKASILHSVASQNQDIEASNDQSSDYFNSSRVYLLKTPERNRSQRANAVTCRNDEDFVDKFFAASESPADMFRRNTSSHLFAESEVGKNDASPSPGLPRNDHSFLFSAVDLSRISDDDSVDLAVKASPGISFATHVRERRRKAGETGDVFLRMRDNLHPIRSGINSPAFRSSKQIPTTSPRDDVPQLDPNNLSFGFYQRKSPPSTPQFLRSDSVSDFAENLTLSPIGSRSRQTTPSYKLLHQRNSPLSPPSPHDDHISSMLAEYCSTSRGASDSDILRLHNSFSEKPNNKDSSPGADFKNDSPESSSSAFLLRDRRRFRTVVPTRVFFSDSDDFPDQYDSFSVPPTSSGAQHPDSKTIQTTNW